VTLKERSILEPQLSEAILLGDFHSFDSLLSTYKLTRSDYDHLYSFFLRSQLDSHLLANSISYIIKKFKKIQQSSLSLEHFFSDRFRENRIPFLEIISECKLSDQVIMKITEETLPTNSSYQLSLILNIYALNDCPVDNVHFNLFLLSFLSLGTEDDFIVACVPLMSYSKSLEHFKLRLKQDLAGSKYFYILPNAF
jgi:hypothetical protein